MDNNYLPKTKKELENWMKENCYNFNGYSINGNAIFEGYGIDNTEGIFTWYFTERGQITNLQSFQSENEIVAFAYSQIKADKWGMSHCIGFTTSKDEMNELQNILKERSINTSRIKFRTMDLYDQFIERSYMAAILIKRSS